MSDKNIVTIDEFKQKAKEEDTQDIAVRKQFTVEVKEVDEEERTIEVIASTKARDRDNDTINPEGWDLSDYEKNPVILWAHDYSKPPIGKAIANWIQDGQLRQKIQFAPKEANPFAEQVYQLYKGGYLSAVSVGFDPVDWDWSDEEEGNIDFEQQVLLETSAVPVPANPEALMVAGKQGVDTSAIKNWAKDVLDITEAEKVADENIELEVVPVFDRQNKDNDGNIIGNANCPHCDGKIYIPMTPELTKDITLTFMEQVEIDDTKSIKFGNHATNKDGRVLSTRNKELLEEARDDVDKVLKECDEDKSPNGELLTYEDFEDEGGLNLEEILDLMDEQGLDDDIYLDPDLFRDFVAQVKQLKSEQSDYIELEEETLELSDDEEDKKSEEIDINADELSTRIDNAVQEAVKNKTGKII